MKNLSNLLELKFKSFRQAFKHFDLNRKGFISEADWLRGLK